MIAIRLGTNTRKGRTDVPAYKEIDVHRKAMRRCGQYADGLITDPKTWKEPKTEFHKGATDVGKDPGRMPVFIEQYVVVGGKAELKEAAELWRFGPKAWKPYFNIRDLKTIQERAEAEVPIER